jgi:ubiquinone/menaquinone biosynthesis C-methylase UbiE
MKMVILEKWFINSARHSGRIINRADKLFKFLDMKENQSYLEVGCGNGKLCKHVAEKYSWNVTGVDVDPGQIQLAQESCMESGNIRFLTTDATDLQFPDRDYDIVLSFGTTHHISYWLDALREMRRVLKPGGYFIYYDLVYSGSLARLGRSFKHSYGIITMPELDNFIETNDFTKVHSSKRNFLIWYDYEAVYRSA